MKKRGTSLRHSADKRHLETSVVHAGREPDRETGAVVAPLHLSTTFTRDDAGGFSKGWKYTRYDNPTRRSLEHCIAELEGGSDACAFGSGMAAAHAVFQLCRPGDHVVVSRNAYTGVLRLVDEVLRPSGLEVTLADLTDTAALEHAVPDGTRLVWAETPSNPLLKITDLAAVSGRAHAVGAVSCCDNTFATPVLQRPFEHGFDLVMHSSTKYLGGHSDVLGGLVAVREDTSLLDRLRAWQAGVGAVPAPFDCYLVLRGIATLALRVRTQSANAAALAAWLTEQPQVRAVHYPSGSVAARQMSAFGGIVSIELGDAETAIAVANRTRLFRHATSLGGVESLIEHRASGEPPESPTPKSLLRLSVGIEHVDDLRDDLAQALQT